MASIQTPQRELKTELQRLQNLETKANLPERLLTFFTHNRGEFISKKELCEHILLCHKSSLSPAWSRLRKRGIRVLMSWDYVNKRWTYTI